MTKVIVPTRNIGGRGNVPMYLSENTPRMTLTTITVLGISRTRVGLYWSKWTLVAISVKLLVSNTPTAAVSVNIHSNEWKVQFPARSFKDIGWDFSNGMHRSFDIPFRSSDDLLFSFSVFPGTIRRNGMQRLFTTANDTASSNIICGKLSMLLVSVPSKT